MQNFERMKTVISFAGNGTMNFQRIKYDLKNEDTLAGCVLLRGWHDVIAFGDLNKI